MVRAVWVADGLRGKSYLWHQVVCLLHAYSRPSCDVCIHEIEFHSLILYKLSCKYKALCIQSKALDFLWEPFFFSLFDSNSFTVIWFCLN
jgi:hypothetical protein